MDAIGIMERDHAVAEKLFQHYERGRRDRVPNERRTETLRDITRALSAHAAAEEQVIYPIVRKELPDGQRLAHDSLKDHQGVKESLDVLGRTPLENPEFDRRMDALILHVRHHVKKEEGELFEKLRGWLGKARLLEIGKALESVSRFSPTRPHPMAPNRPPANLVTGPAAAVVDRVMDVADEGRAKAMGAANAVVNTLRGAVDERMSGVRKSALRTGERLQEVVEEGQRRIRKLSRVAGLTESTGQPAKSATKSRGPRQSPARRTRIAPASRSQKKESAKNR